MQASRATVFGVALAGIVAVGTAWVLPLNSPVPLPAVDSPATLAVLAVTGLAWLAAVLVALRRQPGKPLWKLMFAYLIGFRLPWALEFVVNPVVQGLARIIYPMPFLAVFSHVVVAYPSGHLGTRFDRKLILALYAISIVPYVLIAAMWQPGSDCSSAWCPANVLLVWPNNELATGLGQAMGLAAPVLGAPVLYAVWRHWQTATPAARRVLLPVVVALPIAYVIGSLGSFAEAIGNDWLLSIAHNPVTGLTSLIVPAGLLLGVLQLRLDRGRVAGAIVELGALPTLNRLQQVLQVRLGDQHLRVLRWSPAQAAWIDFDGRDVAAPAPDSERSFLVIDRDGAPVAAVDHDASLLDDAGLASMVESAALIALDATDLREELRAHGGSTGGLPTGEVTFVFCDIEGSTPLLEQLGERYADLLAEVRHVASEIADRHGGRLVDALGDEVFLVFPEARGAVATAIELTRRMGDTRWPDGRTVRLRIGIHTGRPDLTRSGYVGIDVHRASRVMAAGHGGQIVASLGVAAAIDPGNGTSLRPLGRFALRGLSEPMSLFQLEAPGLLSDFPPPRAAPVGQLGKPNMETLPHS